MLRPFEMASKPRPVMVLSGRSRWTANVRPSGTSLDKLRRLFPDRTFDSLSTGNINIISYFIFKDISHINLSGNSEFVIHTWIIIWKYMHMHTFCVCTSLEAISNICSCIINELNLGQLEFACILVALRVCSKRQSLTLHPYISSWILKHLFTGGILKTNK